MNIYDFLKTVKPRLHLYVGSKNLTLFGHFIDGYLTCIELNKEYINHSEVPPLKHFQYWALNTIKADMFAEGIYNSIIRRCDNNMDRAIDLFFELVEKFSNELPEKIEVLTFTEEVKLKLQRSKDFEYYYHYKGFAPDKLSIIYYANDKGTWVNCFYKDDNSYVDKYISSNKIIKEDMSRVGLSYWKVYHGEDVYKIMEDIYQPPLFQE